MHTSTAAHCWVRPLSKLKFCYALFACFFVLLCAAGHAFAQNSLPNSVSSKPVSLLDRLSPSRSIASNEPLPAEKAFVLSVSRQADKVSIQFEIAPTYYLYKDQISVKAVSPAQALTLSLPNGMMKFDETFGKVVETYRGLLMLPSFKTQAQASEKLEFEIYSQGCADMGICYPPQRQKISFQPGQLQAQVSTLEYQANDSIPKSSTAKSLVADQGVMDKRTPTHATTQTITTQTIEQKRSENGQLIVVPPANTANQAFAAPAASPQSSAANVSPPRTETAVVQGGQSNTVQSAALKGQTDLNANNELSRLQQLLLSKNWFWLSLSFIGLGVLLAFTPCVLPMVPIVSAIILGRQQQTDSAEPSIQSSAQAFKLCLIYVLGMSFTYTLFGLAAGLAGQGLSVYLQHPAMLISFALLMVLLAGSQMGWYSLSLPQSWVNRLQNRQGSGSKQPYLGVAIMGALSALMVGPCVTAPLAAVLTYIAQTGDALVGALALFSLSLGMGIPLLLFAVGGKQYLPKTGAWMQTVNHVFAIMLLGLAVWTIQSLLPSWALSSAAVILLLLFAHLLGAFSAFADGNIKQTQWLNVLGLVPACWAFLIVVGMAMGRYDVLTPLAAWGQTPQAGAAQATSNLGGQTSKLSFTVVRSENLDQAIASSRGRLVLLDVYADWCVSCIEFERFTFSQTPVANAMQSFALIKLDVTQNTAADREMLKKLKLFGPPGILFFDRQGQEIASSRVIGFQSAAPFLNHLNQIAMNHR